MTKERCNQIIDKAYNDYCDSFNDSIIEPNTKEVFIDKCKHSIEYSVKWGLKIEERVLSTIERMEYYGKHYMKEHESMSFDNLTKIDYDELNIPTKLFTITYNGETIESYDND
jgi:hypothetical protein